MKVDFTFLHVDGSEFFMAHAEECLEKIQKFENRPLEIHVHCAKVKHQSVVTITVMEGRRTYKAHAGTNDYYRSLEETVNKLAKQMAKNKKRFKNHHNAERSHYGKLARLTPELEYDFDAQPLRKAS